MSSSHAALPPQMDVVPCGRIVGSIRPPGKSLTNRALVMAALARGPSYLTGVLDSEDTSVMLAAWQQLGIDIEGSAAEGCLNVHGCGGLLSTRHAELYIANSGTTIRFLTAALAACEGDFVLDGVPRMRERPIGDLLVALRELGANVESLNKTNQECPPVHVHAEGCVEAPLVWLATYRANIFRA